MAEDKNFIAIVKCGVYSCGSSHESTLVNAHRISQEPRRQGGAYKETMVKITSGLKNERLTQHSIEGTYLVKLTYAFTISFA